MRYLPILVLLIPLAAVAVFDSYDVGASSSIAGADDARALWVNPAGLGMRPSMNLYFSWGGWGDLWEDVSGAIQMWGLTVGYRGETDLAASPVETRTRVNRFSVGLAGGTPNLSLGVALDWYGLETKDYISETSSASFDLRLGLLWRPWNFLSLGLTADNLTNERLVEGPQPRSYSAGLALRPLAWLYRHPDLVTLSFDAAFLEDEQDYLETADQLSWRAGLELRPLDGLVLAAGYDDDENLTVGAAVEFTNLTLGWGGALTTDGDFTAMGGSAAMQIERKPPLLELAPPSVLVLQVGGAVNDEPAFFSLLGGSGGGSALTDLLRDLRRAREDGDVRGVLLELKPVGGLFGELTATLQELGREIRRTRDAGVPVYAVFNGDGVDPGAYYLASFCNRLYLPRLVSLGGFGSSLAINRFGAFAEKYGIDLETITAGDYKASFWPTTSESSEVQRAAIDELLGDSQDQLLAAIAENRGLSRTVVDGLEDRWTIHPADALSLGLVDEIGNVEEALVGLARATGAEAASADDVPVVAVADRTYWEREWGRRPRIAVVGAYGSIMVGESSRSFVDGSRTMGSVTVAGQLDEARRDPLVKAVVLRIDSGGGSAVASDEIGRAVTRCIDAGKPVIVSMGNMAASGGYWIACPGEYIFADPATMTGSIGVINVNFSLERLLAEQGIKREIYKRGKYADLGDFGHRLSEEEQKLVQGELDFYYDIFVKLVADARGMTPDQVREVAGGRVWTGRQALAHGLVDEMGGLREALEYARRAAGIEHPRPDLVTYGNWGPFLFELFYPDISAGLGYGPLTQEPLDY